MDINLLALGLGNSRLLIGAFIDGELDRNTISRVPLDDRATWQPAIEKAWTALARSDSPVIVGASVNPPLLEAVEHVVEQTTGQSMKWVGDDVAPPIKLKIERTFGVGIDRFLTAAAAFEQMGKGCVIVDAGTAVTVNCINDAGEFLGGAIAPGVAVQLEAMHRATAKLPQITLERPTSVFATNTEQAMRQGVYHGIRGLVKELVENYATELGYWPDLIATGGDAAALFEGWDLVHAVAPDLLLYGVALAAVEDALKRDE